MFTKYKKEERGTKILLFYLILNGFLEDEESEKDLKVEVAEEEYKFGLKVKKLYGIIDYVIDRQGIERELDIIRNPIICSKDSFELYSQAKEVYVYSPEADLNEEEEAEQPADNGEDEERAVKPVLSSKAKKELYINDLGILSNLMVISDDLVIADKKANPFDSDQCVYGFEDFKEYVLTDSLTVGNWDINYKDKVFTVSYQGKIIYSAVEIDKTSTYKMVIYIIKKVRNDAEVLPDRFIVTKYVKVVGDED